MGTINIVLSIITVITALVALYENFQKVKARRKAELLEKEKEASEKVHNILNERLSVITGEILEKVKENYTSLEVNKENRICLEEEIAEIRKAIERLHRKNDERDKAYIRQEILFFAKELREGAEPTDLDYKNLLEFYDYYKNTLKGNSYIDDEVIFIKKIMRDKRKLGDRINESINGN